MWNHATKRCTDRLRVNLAQRSKLFRCPITDVCILARYSSGADGPKKSIKKFEFIPEKPTSYDKAKLKEKTTKKGEILKGATTKPDIEQFIKISPVAPTSDEPIEFPKISHQTPQYIQAEIAKINRAVIEENVTKKKLNAADILASLKNIKGSSALIDKRKTSEKQQQQKTKGQILLGEQLSNDDSSDRSWKTMKYSLTAIGFIVTTVGAWMYVVLGAPKTDDEGIIIQDVELATLPVWKQYFWRMIKELMYYEKLIKEPSRDKLLPDVVTYPYYQPPYTLVLELTDVLVHPEWSYLTGWRFKKRPGIDQFLESISGHFEIVIYTAEMGMTVFPIIDALDPKNLISYKLVRDATYFVDGHHVKDLDKLNRDLSKVIVVDWNENATKLHQDNLFHIDRWSGNDNDSTLIDLSAFLRMVAQWEIEDVREVLRYYGRFDSALGAFNERRREMLASVEAS